MKHRRLKATAERLPLRFSNVAKLCIGLGVLISIASQGDLDPTPFNLLTPAEGIRNWLGLPGALLGGLLIEGLGRMSLLFPLYLLFVRNASDAGFFRISSKNVVTLLLLTSLVSALAMGDTMRVARLTGLWGTATNQVVTAVFGRFLSSCLIVFLLAVHNFGFRGSYRLDKHLFAALGAALSLIPVLANRAGSQILALKKRVLSSAGRLKGNVRIKTQRQSNVDGKHTAGSTVGFLEGQFIAKIRLFANQKSARAKQKADRARKEIQNRKESIRREKEKLPQTPAPAEEYVYATEYGNRLHQAIREFKKANFPKNDTEIEDRVNFRNL